MKKTLFGGLLAAIVAVAPIAASAQAPDWQFGKIVSIDSKYQITIAEPTGDLLKVALHKGTVILPTGVPLREGMVMIVSGPSDHGTIAANEIRTPYQWHGRGIGAGQVAQYRDQHDVHSSYPANIICGFGCGSGDVGVANLTDPPTLSAPR